MAKRKPNPQQRTLAGFDDELPAAETPAPVRAKSNRGTGRSTTTAAAAKLADEVKPRPDGDDVPVVYLVDAHGLIYQVFHAMPEMTSPTGQPVGAIHGFLRDLVDLLQNRRPDYLVCAFDAPGDNFRHALYPAYKEHREEMPGDLQAQIEPIQRMLAAMGVPALGLPGYEADDLLATLAADAERQGWKCRIVTGDKDCRQLLSERTAMFNIRKNELFDVAALRATWGIEPSQVVDFQSLVGDSVDNVPGVPLIGPKNAQELLTRFGTLEGLFEHVQELPAGKRKENLIAGREQAFKSRELARLRSDVPLAFDWESGRVARAGAVDQEELQRLCREHGFRHLAERLAKLTAAAAPVEWIADYRCVRTVEELDAMIADLSSRARLVVDVETTSLHPRSAEIVGYALCGEAGRGYYAPVKGSAGEELLPADLAKEKLKPLLENSAIAKIGQNLKYDLIVLRSHGINVQGVAFDTMVASFLLDPGQRSHNLDDLAKRYLNHRTITIDTLIGTGKDQLRMDQAPVDAVAQYAAEDADVPMRLVGLLEPRLKDEGLAELFHDMEMPLIEVLAEMEFNGVRIDVELLRGLGERFAERMAITEKEIHELAGGPFNVNSPKQLAEILYEKFQLPVVKRTQSGPSTDAEALEELAELHPLPAKIVEFRQFAKLKGTYVDALPTMICPQTRRVHTSFRQDGASTGRLSSQDPNLQNIPVRTEEGRAIRAAFRPGPDGWKLLCADYSQIELRVLAHFSGDTTLQAAFAEDKDIHALVAAQVYEVPLDQVTYDQRRSAKAINFGIIYGQSSFGLAKSLDISKGDAQRFIDAYFARYPGVDAFMETALDGCRRDGYVTTISGRRRPVEGVRSRASRGAKRQRILPERIAINSIIQGSAADLIKLAMIRVHRRLKERRSDSEPWRAKLLLQIHDELVFEAPPEELNELTSLARTEMENVMRLSVPLKVDVKSGDNWAACE